MSKPKYFGIYSGPSYSSYDAERAMGFSSLKDARHAFQSFHTGGLSYDEYRLNADGCYVPWSMGTYDLTPGASAEDHMDLHVAIPGETPGTYDRCEEIECRMMFGERGGIVVER